MADANFFQRVLRFHRRHGTAKLLGEVRARVVRRVWTPIEKRLPEKPPMHYVRETAVELLLKVLGPGYQVVEPITLTRSTNGVRANEVVEHRFRHGAPLRFFPTPAEATRRINIVTDSVNAGSLFGGVATAVILGALAAQDQGCRLRIITRTEPPRPDSLDAVLHAYGIQLSHDLEFSHAPIDEPNAPAVAAGPDELFITTSWWTTAATLPTVDTRQVVYLLQEDERMFYAHGDELLRCEAVLRTPDIRFIVNSRLLYDHLVGSGLRNVAERGTWFEPAFPPQVFHAREKPPGHRPTLLFYARPNNARNLFHLGIEVLDTAVGRGIIDPEVWDVVFVGKDIPPVLLGDGACVPRRLENLDWQAYADLAGRTDLALSLMYTPHPSYPPFDLAASGAVVVTNTYGNKQDLSHYSANILCAAPERRALVDALAAGAALALDAGRRAAHHQAQHVPASWREAYERVRGHFEIER